ncbi:MAG TPA: hypothetical protein VMZ52_17250 [Bryobacteraceae bacterium]|nr:hypothetical protein [Bryobacteraceae bacterium]
MWLLRSLILAAVLNASFNCAFAAQEQNPAPNESTNEFFSGTVADLQPGKIIISRAVLGKPAEDRSFLITPETKIEGKLKAKVRVTVGFKASDEGDVAVRIIVRAPQRK